MKIETSEQLLACLEQLSNMFLKGIQEQDKPEYYQTMENIYWAAGQNDEPKRDALWKRKEILEYLHDHNYEYKDAMDLEGYSYYCELVDTLEALK